MSVLGTNDPSSSQYDFIGDLANIESDVEKTYDDEVGFLKSGSNVFRILGATAGVVAASVYNGNQDIKTLAYQGGIMALSSIVSIHLGQMLQYKQYVEANQQEHVIVPASMGLYYLISNRSLNLSEVNNSLMFQTLMGGAGSLGAEYFFNNQKPKSSSKTKSKSKSS